MDSKLKTPVTIGGIVVVLILVGIFIYSQSGPAAIQPKAVGAQLTVAKLVEKAEKDPSSLTPDERKFYNQLPPAQIEAVKQKIQQSAEKPSKP